MGEKNILLKQNANVIASETTRKTSAVTLANHIQVHFWILLQHVLPVCSVWVGNVKLQFPYQRGRAAQITGVFSEWLTNTQQGTAEMISVTAYWILRFTQPMNLLKKSQKTKICGPGETAETWIRKPCLHIFQVYRILHDTWFWILNRMFTAVCYTDTNIPWCMFFYIIWFP